MPRLEDLLRGREGDPLFFAFALLVAAFLGAAHALTPGHGKTIVAAYLAGSRGRMADAFYLGGVVTITHTASVFILGVVTLSASQFLPLEKILPILSLISGLLVVGIGAWLLFQRITGRDHPHEHTHSHGEIHRHGSFSHSHPSGRGHTYSHSHPGTSRAGLLSLGISGGLVPCPEALVVLMLSVSLGRLLFGLALLTAFTLGLAAVLIAIGCAMVVFGPAMRRFSGKGWFAQRLPVISASVVTLLGGWMVMEAVRSYRA
jgi:ABC-type nickel/cobalt efflux system permease component RcnA